MSTALLLQHNMLLPHPTACCADPVLQQDLTEHSCIISSPATDTSQAHQQAYQFRPATSCCGSPLLPRQADHACRCGLAQPQYCMTQNHMPAKLRASRSYSLLDASCLEVDDVTVCHCVVLPLLPVLARCLDRMLCAQLMQLIIVHHFSTDEALLKVSVDGASSLQAHTEGCNNSNVVCQPASWHSLLQAPATAMTEATGMSAVAASSCLNRPQQTAGGLDSPAQQTSDRHPPDHAPWCSGHCISHALR